MRGCACCAGRSAVIAQLEAERAAAARSAADLSCALARERKEREAAELRLQRAVDRLEFVEPMYATVRTRYEELYGQHADLSRMYGEAEGEKAALARSLDAVKMQAALAVSLESENAGLKEYAAGRDREIGRLLAELVCVKKTEFLRGGGRAAATQSP